MDLERLTIEELRKVSQFIDTIGIPADMDTFSSYLRILRALTAKYEQAMSELQQSVRAHDA